MLLLLVNIFFSYSLDVSVNKFFSNLNYGNEALFLKNYFTKITQLGDSLWYFLIISIVFFVTIVLRRIKIISSKNYLKLKNLLIFCFLYLAIVGLVTQLLKHVIGRPRPNHTDLDEGFGFNFFSMESSFHSFPSGHSSTIASVALVLGMLFPRIKIIIYIFGFFVAISRVVVGAHYITDVIAGFVLAIMIYKIFIVFFKSKSPELISQNTGIIKNSLLIHTGVVSFILAVFITLGFDFDIFFSGLFYRGDSQFFLQSTDLVSIIFRKILLPFLLLYIFVFPIFGIFIPIHSLFFGYSFKIREIIYIWGAGITTLLLVVNILLKNMWGRARPNDILNFGGSSDFSPWFKISDSCVSNCSFVSGDASVGFMLVSLYFVTNKKIYFYLALIIGSTLGIIRISAGGHFLSDVIFSQIVVMGTLFSIFGIYKKLNVK
tara:strand:- start:2043 stop:3338 length:1296 start_codon:yes stop_codon:yes gene_type:complete